MHERQKCQNRSRLTPVQRKRSSVPTPMRKGQTESTGNAYKTSVKSTILIDFRGRLITIGPAKFEAERPRAGSF